VERCSREIVGPANDQTLSCTAKAHVATAERARRLSAFEARDAGGVPPPKLR